MKIPTILGVLAVAGVAASASAQNRGVNTNGLWGTGVGQGHGAAGGDSPTVYSQPSESADGFFSDGVPGQFWSQRIADNFTLADDAAVDGIRWWGSSENYFAPDLSNFKNFVIEFYNDAGGLPGAPIGQVVVGTGNTNATLTGFQNASGGDEYLMETSLNLNLLGGVQYWVSVGAENNDPLGDGFVWSTNFTSGDGDIAGDFFDGGGYQGATVGSDQAFELTAAVPAPGAAALLGLGGMIAARRRRA